ncbi:MAG: hypothetical protein QOE79_2347 [Sphingomonadales bacterium]|nr:hypothetical protein [Sphingomonadales bacterium]
MGAHLLKAVPGAAAVGLALGCAALARAQTQAPVMTAPPAPPPAHGALPSFTVAPPPHGPEIPKLPLGTRVRLPFAPPLDRPLVYYWSETGRAGEHGANVDGEVTIRFTRAGDFYLMETRTTLFGMPLGLAATPEMQLLVRPLTFRLDRDGTLVGVENEEQYWRSVEEIVTRLARRPGARKDDVGLMRRIFRSMHALPQAERVAIFARRVGPITALAGLDMAVGETVQPEPVEAQLPLPGVQAKLKQRWEITLSEATAARVRVDSVARFDEAGTQAVMADIAKLAPAGAGIPERLRISRTIEQEALRESGLIRRYHERIIVETEAGSPKAIRLVTLGLVER